MFSIDASADGASDLCVINKYELLDKDSNPLDIPYITKGDKASDDIKVKVEDNVLSITGSSEDEDGDFVHKGIAKRSFRKQLQLQEYVECKGAKLEDGMLKINLEYNPPEEKKAKIIDVD